MKSLEGVIMHVDVIQR